APRVFYGYRPVHFAETLPGERRPGRVLLGREVSLRLEAVGVDLDARPGRHLAVLGSDPAGGEVLEAAAQSLAHHAAPGREIWAVDFTEGHDLSNIGYSLPPGDFAAKLPEVPDDTVVLVWGLEAAALDLKGQQALRTLLRT